MLQIQERLPLNTESEIERTIAENLEMITPVPIDDLEAMLKGLDDYKNHSKVQNGFEILGRGHFGVVLGYKQYAIKYVSGGANSYQDYVEHGVDGKELLDAFILKRIHHHSFIPTLYAVVNNNTVIMERINGLTANDYRRQMDDVKKMDNFIHPNFCEIFNNSLETLTLEGFDLCDLHSDNFMISRDTGLPMIIDVGLFCYLSDEKMKDCVGNSHHTIIRSKLNNLDSAMGNGERLHNYCIEKRFPELLEERKRRMIKANDDYMKANALNTKRRLRDALNDAERHIKKINEYLKEPTNDTESKDSSVVINGLNNNDFIVVRAEKVNKFVQF